MLWQATLTLTTAAIPTSGVLNVALLGTTAALPPYDAVTALDSFMLTAQNWVGEPGRQLQYEFRSLQVKACTVPECKSVASQWNMPTLNKSLHEFVVWDHTAHRTDETQGMHRLNGITK